MNLDTIYNSNYGSRVVTNGEFVAVGNPPTNPYDTCEGFARVGQVFLIKKDKFNSNYNLKKILQNNDRKNLLFIPYFAEQSSSIDQTGSFLVENSTCELIVQEYGQTYQLTSDYGNSFDMSNYFLAVGDYNFLNLNINSLVTYISSVDIYEINPNYTFTDTSSGVLPYVDPTSTSQDAEDYTISDNPICTLMGNPLDEFGKCVSISDNYLAIGAPAYNSGSGAVYVFRYTDADCRYAFDALLTASTSYPTQKGFGFSISIDKKNEDKIVVGSNQISQSNVYLFWDSGSTGNWKLTQVFSQNTSSEYYTLQDSDFGFYPSGSQELTRYGYSVSMYDDILAVGAPNDLIYWDYSGSTLLRQRGATYIYKNKQCDVDVNCKFELLDKIYGDTNTFKDNLMGFSVSVNKDNVLIGVPKPYFPFSSYFLSESMNSYNKGFTSNDLGESTYCGQTLLYNVSGSVINNVTTIPIAKRKEYGKPFNAYGYSVSISDQNIVIGAPVPLNPDFQLTGVIITESGSAADADYIETSSFQSDECDVSSKFVYTQIEEDVSCPSPSDIDVSPAINRIITGVEDGNLYSSLQLSGALSGALSRSLVDILFSQTESIIVFGDETGDYDYTANSIFGQAYIYDFSDLQKNYSVGNVFYNNNLLVLNTTGSILNNLTLDPVDSNDCSIYMNYESQVTLFEKQYICTIEPGEFNVSTNPSAITASSFEYSIDNKLKFDFNNLDLILRYINTKITANNSEKWWDNFVSGENEESILSFYSSSIENYNENRLTQKINYLCSAMDFDVNDDGNVSSQDGIAIWKYFIGDLSVNNYEDLLTPRSRRKVHNEIVSFLNEKTGKSLTIQSKPEFFEYKALTDNDPTGSYLAPYITTVGLYSDGDLVAVAKLAHPIKNTGEIPINIVVKWDT